MPNWIYFVQPGRTTIFLSCLAKFVFPRISRGEALEGVLRPKRDKGCFGTKEECFGVISVCKIENAMNILSLQMYTSFQNFIQIYFCIFK